MKTIGVTGASGFIGRAVCAALHQRGDAVRALVRNPQSVQFPPGVQVCRFDGEQFNPASTVEGLDAVIHLAGESVAGSWTPDKKQKIHASRVIGTRNLVNTMLLCEQPPKILLSASASGYYGSRGDEPLEEAAPPGDDFLARVCVDWEAEARRAENFGVRVVRLRQGLVWGANGGALQAMLPAFKWGAGGPLGSGNQWWPWIHLDDLVALYLFLLDRADIAGPLNAVSPDLATNARFARALGYALGRPSLAPAPRLALKTLLGEFADSLLSSQLLLPGVAEDHGFVWQHPRLEQALLAIFKSGRKPPIERFEASELVAADPQQVFRFFSDASNLAVLTPPGMAFAMLTPRPAVMQRGTILEYRLKVRGVGVRWKSLITAWRQDAGFTDVQLRGPFQLWRHRHTFAARERGVLVNDQVEYSLPLAPLSNLALPFLRRDVEEIFRYRKQQIAEALAPAIVAS